MVDALAAGWELRVDDIEYAPVGFGSFHWRATAGSQRWFVTVDDLQARRHAESEPLDGPRRRLTTALATARSLRDAGLEFVVAPIPSTAGHVVERVGERFSVALYPHVAGETYSWGGYPTRADRLAVIDLIVRLHGSPPSACGPALVDDLAIPGRDGLIAALADRTAPWSAGPFGEGARALLDRHAVAVRNLLGRYDELAARVRSRPERMVVTHGEPHRANTITTSGGVVLIDWDTALLAPPERDLWALAAEDPEVLGAYTAQTGATVDDDALDLYRMWWDLAEIAAYVGDFRRAHADTEDTRVAWAGLQGYLDPARWRGGGGGS